MLPRSRLSDALSQRPIRRQFHIAGPHNSQAAAPPTAAACTAARSLLLRRNPFDGVVPDRVHQRTARLNTTKVSDAAIADGLRERTSGVFLLRKKGCVAHGGIDARRHKS